MDPKLWHSVQEYFHKAVALQRTELATFLFRVDDAAVRTEVESLLRAHEQAELFLEPPLDSTRWDPRQGTLLPEQCLGSWRIVRFIGHGGMGEVYEATRINIEFKQRAALKVIRPEAVQHLDRFNVERRILARLDHPGIARLLDGGLAPDGRPYAVMEYVEGESLLQYCKTAGADLTERLRLFVQVCDAVAYAHRNLVIHRDIKPSNVLVDRDGRARLLDFGIAKLVDASEPQVNHGAETARFLTPDYAAPEQLIAEPATTATDVYALGLLLFELLVGRRPWLTGDYPLAKIVASVMERHVPKASTCVRDAADAAVAPSLLKGDLDSIIAKCLRPEPEQRYATVNALLGDVERSQRGDPITARSGARFYVMGRLLRRYRWAVVGVGIVVVTLGIGIATTLWQAQRAEQAAARANATRDFLLDVFRASDPRKLRDRPPGSITAKELLDLSVDRIEKEFSSDPQTQLELLGIASEIYGHWLDDEKFHSLIKKREAIARQRFGPTHPVVIESVTLDAWDSIYSQHYAEAHRLLAHADQLIRLGGHENSQLRAEWWLAQAEALKIAPIAQRRQALDRAVELYSKLDRTRDGYAIALANSATAYLLEEDFVTARQRNEQAIEAFTQVADRNEGEVALTYANYARSLQSLGEFEAAERAYEHCKSLLRRLDGERHGTYWVPAADHARLVHLRGDQQRAQRMFAALLAVIPEDWRTTIDDVIAREYYAERLAAEGRVAEAIPLLEAAERTYVERPRREFDLRRVRLALGDAYDRAGRIDQARRLLSQAREERMRKDRADSIAVLSSRERWARFLLDHGSGAAARHEYLEVVRLGHAAPTYPLALSHAGLARLAMADGDHDKALQESGDALRIIEQERGLYDVRILPLVWKVHAGALELAGEADKAREYRGRALRAERGYNGSAAAQEE